MGTGQARIAVGSDMPHETVAAVADELDARGAVVVRCGAAEGTGTPWPLVAEQVARLVATGAVDTAVPCCWTGTGVSIAANKVPGVRAALCADAETARGARRWNDANIIALGLATTEPARAREIVRAWLEPVAVDPAEVENIARVTAMEARYGAGPGIPSTQAST